jgi:hypothetical protein
MLNACDLLAKSFYSAVATDIGRTHGPNILTDESVLQTVTSNYSEIAKTFRLVAAGPATDSYDALKSTIGQPMITPSTIFTSYLCQTPEKKLISALVVSVLLANLVLLRALWSIVTMAATYLVNLRNPKGGFAGSCSSHLLELTFASQLIIVSDVVTTMPPFCRAEVVSQPRRRWRRIGC